MTISFKYRSKNMAFITLVGFCFIVALSIYIYSTARASYTANALYNSYLVAIDPGHGGNDPGTQASGIVEKDANLDICRRLNTILQKSGIKTYMTRDSDTFVYTRNRIEMANVKKASLYLSIHCNWLKEPDVDGIQTFYYPSTKLRVGNLVEKDYAQKIHSNLLNELKATDRGLRADPNLTVLKHAQMPSVLIELGFLSNESDAAKLKSASFRQKAAEALAEGIKNSLKAIKS
jgi:N-acetylmuramoyl-L-alanine amidase